jgi:PAS domain S-box-containing protein
LLEDLRDVGFEIVESDEMADEGDLRGYDAVVHPPADGDRLPSSDGPGDGPLRFSSALLLGDPKEWATVINQMAREREQAKLLSCVLETSPDLEAWIDPGGDCRYISPSCEDLTGYPPDAYRLDSTLLVRSGHLDDQERLRASIFGGGGVVQTFCCRIVTRNGEVRRVVHKVIPCQDESGNPIGVRVHQQRAPDEDPAQEIQRLRTLLGQTEGDRALLTAVIESLPIGVIAMGAAGELLVANPAAVPYLEQVRGAPIPAEAYIGHYRELERQLRGHDGQPQYLHLTSGPLARTGHRIFGAVGAIQDITHTRASAQARRRELAEAKQQIWRLEGANTDLRQQLEDLQNRLADVEQIDETVVETTPTRTASDEPTIPEIGGLPPGDFSEIVAEVPDQAWVLDAEMRVQYVNRAGADAARCRSTRLLGHPWSEVPLASGLVREVGRKAATAIIERSERGGVWTDGVEGVAQLRHYSVRPVSLGSAGPSVLVTIRDGVPVQRFLDDRNRTEDRHERLLTVLRAVLDQMPIGVVIAEAPTGRVLFRNAHFSDIWGAETPSPARVEEYHVWSGTWKSGAPIGSYDWPLARAVLHDERVQNEECIVHREGKTTTVYAVSAGPILDSDGTAFAAAATFVDITARRIAEDAVHTSETRLRAAAHSIPQVFAICDLAGRFLFINEAGLRMTGRTQEEVIGRTSRELFGARNALAFRRLLDHAIANLEPCSGEVSFAKGDGSEFTLLVTLTPLCREDGSCDEILALGNDLTEERRTASTLARFEVDLKRSTDDLQQFAYVASHDLQEPLRSIVSFVQLLERRYRGRLDSDADELIGYVTEGADRMQALINDLLVFSRVSTRNASFTVVPLGDAIADALIDLRPTLSQTGAEIRFESLPSVLGDRSQIGLLFSHLLGNAVKFRRSDVPPVVQIAAVRERGMWHVIVSDNGIGIDPEYFDRIFVIFQRLHTRDIYQGTGIGLAIVKKIVELHGGRIWLESIPGEGSVFHFTLPMAPAGKEADDVVAHRHADGSALEAPPAP